MKNENKTQYYIIYDNREEEKATPNKAQFIDSLIYALSISKDIEKEDIYYIYNLFNEEQHDGTINEITIKINDCSIMTYRKVNL